MKARILPILAWMVIFGGAALLITDIVLIAFVIFIEHFQEPAHPISIEAMFWTIRIFFWFSVLAAFFFGLRGALPGTQASLKTSQTVRFRIYAGALACAVPIVALLVMRSGTRPAVTIAYLGRTNDISGSRIATFVISNADSRIVLRAGRSHVETRDLEDQNAVVLWQSHDGLPATAELPPGGKEVFSVQEPTNSATNAPWRVAVKIYPERRPIMVAKFLSTMPLNAIGLKPKYRIRIYPVNSSWVDRE